jgi:hypothetical protein
MSTIKVTYKYVDGAHFFVSTDKEAAGLCVANTNLEVAYSEVAHQLNALFKFNHGQNCDFQPAVPLDVLKKQLEASQVLARGFDQTGMMMASTIAPWVAQQAGKQ